MKREECEDLEQMAATLYDVFSSYTYPGSDFCTFCYTKAEIQRLTSTPIEELKEDDTRTLLWECWDHWESADVYRHYLPRVLQAMAPPQLLEDLYPSHLFETINALGFADWPERERSAVVSYLEALGPKLENMDEVDRSEWKEGLASLVDAG